MDRTEKESPGQVERMTGSRIGPMALKLLKKLSEYEKQGRMSIILKIYETRIKVFKAQMALGVRSRELGKSLNYLTITFVGIVLALVAQIPSTSRAINQLEAIDGFLLASAGMIGTTLALVFSLSIIPIQRSAETYTPSVTRLYQSDRLTQLIFIALAIFSLASFFMALDETVPLPKIVVVQLEIIMIAASFDLLRLHYRHLAVLLQPREAVSRLTEKMKSYIIWLKGTCSSLARIQRRALPREQRKQVSSEQMEGVVYAQIAPLHNPLKVWASELSEIAAKAVARAEIHTVEIAVSGLVEVAKAYLDSRRTNLRLFPAKEAFLATDNDVDIILSPIYEHLKDLNRAAVGLKAETACIYVIRAYREIAIHTLKLQSPVFPPHEAPLTYVPIFYMLGCVEAAQDSGLDDAALEGSSALSSICKSAPKGVDHTDVYSGAFEGWQQIASRFLVKPQKAGLANRVVGNMLEIVGGLVQQKHHALRYIVQDALEKIEHLMPLALIHEKMFGSPAFGAPLENVYSGVSGWSVAELVRHGTALIEKTDPSRPWGHPYHDFMELNEVIFKHLRIKLAEKLDFGGSQVLLRIIQTLKEIVEVYLALLRQPLVTDDQQLKALADQIRWYESFFWVAFSKMKSISHREAEEACDVLAWIGMAAHSVGYKDIFELSAENIHSVLGDYCKTCKEPNPYEIADLLMYLWRLRILSEAYGDAVITGKLDQKLGKPESVRETLWPHIQEALELRKRQLQESLSKSDFVGRMMNDATALLSELLRQKERQPKVEMMAEGQ